MSIKKRIFNKLKKMLGVYSLSHKEDRLYTLCQRYMSVWDAGDGYWLTVTELDMYEEIKRRHVELGILKRSGIKNA